MLNALLLSCILFLELIFIIRFSKLSKEWLYGFIIVNLLLVSVLGGKLISIFGFTTNTGNTFYVAVFLATYMLVECFSVKDAYKSVWIGSISVFLFMLMAQLVKSMVAIPEARVIDQSIYNLIQANLRVSVASIFSFVTAQSVNIWLYQFLRKKTKTKHFWLRVLVSNGVAQAVDSALFFLIAFVEVVPFSALWSIIIISYILKFGVGLFAIPFLYDALPNKKEGGAA